MAEARFEVFMDKKGEYRFRLVAPNNEIVAVSEGYKTKQGCLKGINAVKKYSGAEIEFDSGTYGLSDVS